MAVRGGATCGTRIKVGEEGRYVANERNGRGWEGCGGTDYGWGCTGDRNDNRRVVVKGVRNSNNREWMVGMVGSGNGNWGFRYLGSQHLSVLWRTLAMTAAEGDRRRV